MLQSAAAFIKQPGCGSGMRLKTKTTALLAIAVMCATPRLIAAERGPVLDVVDRVAKFEKFVPTMRQASSPGRRKNSTAAKSSSTCNIPRSHSDMFAVPSVSA